jgi:uncharacterized protein (DUF952 family)
MVEMKTSPSESHSQIILHIATAGQWEQAHRTGSYEADSLRTEGFIHCSTPDQVVEVAHRLFRDRTDLLLLVINPARLDCDLRFEIAENGKTYPHIYGVIQAKAVIRVIEWSCAADGSFELPAFI